MFVKKSKQLLEHIASKGSETKGRYAFFIALFVTLMIGLIWASTIPSRFANINANKEDVPSPLDNLMVETKENLGTVIESMGREEEVFSENMDMLDLSSDEEKEATSTTISDFFIKDENTATTTIVAPKIGPRTILIGTTTRP